MAIYCIGDIQGCDNALHRLWTRLFFSQPRHDLSAGRIWSTGAHLRRRIAPVYEMMVPFKQLLGNHDLHLLAAAHGARKPSKRDTLAHVLEAPCALPFDWLRQQPLARTHTLAAKTLLMVHAGVAQLDAEDVVALSGELQRCCEAPTLHDFLRQMYGNTPDRWDAALQGNRAAARHRERHDAPAVFARWTA